ncbi:MAG: hypothetical protein B0D96_01495 [Candidatus Sedimenticola endophacoides]|nr:MAG: hypothetical protein B0D94_05770 [Candidatus Sedimenticola endophacoides]OQX37716.1 MAG: hypothetical protein B0D96_01495 [Candidatus Sedimenticola endophacoides]OQX39460.1 MAG: hypothetical protein B0D89_10725 [Candidatus Sedimenticola endophacoides]OQX42843.1 MAG: hypothetical protein B0D82_00385 [Candidatus Sedimenticola endophacoides]OQX45019.1 MAG: hypothetical protein B0D86_04430 [Candidatus Sedimenticola endophacoides]
MQETLFQTIVSPDALKECIRREPAVLIWFTGPGCRLCQDLKPRVATLIGARFPRLALVEVDCARSPEAAAQSRVFSVPTLQIYFEGQHFITKGRSFSLTELSSDLERPYQLFFG